MGVTLERVQNKFACIIGELCSEPVVLSQFAIWLDLRLAEYKAKGAISLECSGEKPDPVWLKGHKDEPARIPSGDVNLAAHRNSFPVGNLNQSDSPRFLSAEDRLSPDDIVVVKEEPSDSVSMVMQQDSSIYPITLHQNLDRLDRSPVRTTSRKRPSETLSSPRNATQSNNGSYVYHSQSPLSHSQSPKIACRGASLSSSLANNSHVSNQSLMSIISGRMESGQSQQVLDHSATNILSDYSALDEHDQEGDNSMIFHSSPLTSTSHLSADESGIGIVQNESMDGSKTVPVYGETIDLEDFVEDCGASQLAASNNNAAAVMSMAAASVMGVSRHSENGHRRSLIKNIHILPKQSVTNMVSAVGVFERWLWGPPCSDFRPITAVEPQKLDSYLVQFYKTVQTPTGGEYKLSSFRTIRDGIERYLKETDYSVCLKTSPVFKHSRGVFAVEYKAKQRTKQLET